MWYINPHFQASLKPGTCLPQHYNKTHYAWQLYYKQYVWNRNAMPWYMPMVFITKGICKAWRSNRPSQKSHDTSDKYPTMHDFVTEMCTHVHICVTKWCIVGYGTGALWVLCERFIVHYVPLNFTHWGQVMHICISKLSHQCWNTVNWILRNKLQWFFLLKFKHSHSRKGIWQCHLRNGGHYVSASMCKVCRVWPGTISQRFYEPKIQIL